MPKGFTNSGGYFVPDEALASAEAMLEHIARIIHDQSKHPESKVYEIGFLVADPYSIENPCVTREEIESLGWEFQNDLFGHRSFYSMKGFGLTFNPSRRSIMVEKIPRNIMYNGPCKSIDDLREICKTLNL
jgi:hypothetical protein